MQIICYDKHIIYKVGTLYPKGGQGQACLNFAPICTFYILFTFSHLFLNFFSRKFIFNPNLFIGAISNLNFKEKI